MRGRIDRPSRALIDRSKVRCGAGVFDNLLPMSNLSALFGVFVDGAALGAALHLRSSLEVGRTTEAGLMSIQSEIVSATVVVRVLDLFDHSPAELTRFAAFGVRLPREKRSELARQFLR